MNGWIGVDLDGTLAVYDGWKGPEYIGEPVPKMVERVKQWLAEGQEVRIFTARVVKADECVCTSVEQIQDWCEKHIGQRLKVTGSKDYGMIALYDDRAKQVIENTGELLEDHVFTRHGWKG